MKDTIVLFLLIFKRQNMFSHPIKIIRNNNVLFETFEREGIGYSMPQRLGIIKVLLKKHEPYNLTVLA